MKTCKTRAKRKILICFIGTMNSIKSQAEEIVLSELIYI